MHFADRLLGAIQSKGTPVLVGIDPRVSLLPDGYGDAFSSTASAFSAFGREVLDAVAGLVPAVKVQAAFYEELGPQGMAALRETAEYAARLGLIVIIDGKRNDIGTTAEAYARAYLARSSPQAGDESRWWSDALTVNAYLGHDGIGPFIDVASRAGTGLFVLVRTSNPSAGEFQDLVADGKPLYRHVAERVAQWAEPHRGASGYSLVGAVAGATYPDQLAELRACLPGVVLLVPGYGSQGATARDVAAAFAEDGRGAIINNSRGVTFAYRQARYQGRFGRNWQRAVEQAVRDMRDELAAETPAGRLAH